MLLIHLDADHQDSDQQERNDSQQIAALDAASLPPGQRQQDHRQGQRHAFGQRRQGEHGHRRDIQAPAAGGRSRLRRSRLPGGTWRSRVCRAPKSPARQAGPAALLGEQIQEHAEQRQRQRKGVFQLRDPGHALDVDRVQRKQSCREPRARHAQQPEKTPNQNRRKGVQGDIDQMEPQGREPPKLVLDPVGGGCQRPVKDVAAGQPGAKQAAGPEHRIVQQVEVVVPDEAALPRRPIGCEDGDHQEHGQNPLGARPAARGQRDGGGCRGTGDGGDGSGGRFGIARLGHTLQNAEKRGGKQGEEQQGSGLGPELSPQRRREESAAWGSDRDQGLAAKTADTTESRCPLTPNPGLTPCAAITPNPPLTPYPCSSLRLRCVSAPLR